MNEIAWFVLQCVVVLAGGLIVTWVLASAIDRARKREVKTGEPVRGLRIAAIALGLISGGLFVFEWLRSDRFDSIWLVASFVLVGYGMIGLLRKRAAEK